MPVTKPKPAPVVEDKTTLKLKAAGQSAEDIQKVKDILKELANDQSKRGNGPINMDIFKKLGELKLCTDSSIKLDFCSNTYCLDREFTPVQGKSSMQKHQRPQGKHGGNDFAMGTGKPHYNNKPYGYQQDNGQSPWKPEDSKEKAKLKEQAIAMQKKVTMEKNEAQKIRLILNVITPENFEKKFKELR